MDIHNPTEYGLKEFENQNDLYTVVSICHIYRNISSNQTMAYAELIEAEWRIYASVN